MTEKKVLQQINNLAFDIQHTDDLQQAFDKAGEILKLIDKDQHPAFAVGEYYYSNSSFVYKMLKVGNAIEPYEVKALDLGDGVMWECTWYEKEIEKDQPATAEQIAEFKRAERFAKHGRKLDEFRVGDKVDICGDEVKVTEVNVWGMNVISIDINGINRHVEAGAFDLIRTAEELQEVGEQ